ncbi:MAG: hypothetical protein ACI9M3_000818 [Bacteroidia bacterium]|jgi:hypothetical protein
MAKELPYFKFEPNQWENGNIQMLSREDKGLFIDLCSMYWSRLGDVPLKLAVQKLCGGNATAFDSLISEQIFEVIDGRICINYLNEQLGEFEDTSKQNSKNAKTRWEKHRKQKDSSDRNATASNPQCESDAIREEKRRGEKSNIDSNKLLGVFNSILGKGARVVPEKAKKQLKAALKAGYSKDDIVKAITNASKDPHHIDSKYKYLTLEFITRPDKLDRFINMSDFTIKSKMI